MSMALFERAVKQHGVNGLARKTGLSPATISRVKNGDYPNPAKVLAKVAELFEEPESGPIHCPVLGDIHPDVCARYAAWSAEGRVHRDRMYRQVKNACQSCAKGKK